MLHTDHPTKAGFTLIEISIVITIIALIVGGILIGKNLIRAAELRSVMSDIERIQNATSNFRQKYNAIPGDMPTAERYWGTDTTSTPCNNTTANLVAKTATCNGDGNGRLNFFGWISYNESYTSPSYHQEVFRFWQHLSNAGFFPGQYTGTEGTSCQLQGIPGVNIPESDYLPKVGYQLMNYNGSYPSGTTYDELWLRANYHYVIHIGTIAVSPCFWPELPFLAAVEASEFDSKFDDGMPSTGSIRTYHYQQAPMCVTDDGTDEGLTSVYLSSSTTSKACALLYIPSWFD